MLPKIIERTPDRFLKAAISIGEHLCRTAIWNKDGTLCNWLGRPAMDINLPDNSVDIKEALGPTFYGGASGIALFLMELYRLTRDEAFASAACSAIRSCVRQIARAREDAISLSHFSGIIGVALTLEKCRTNTREVTDDSDFKTLMATAEQAFYRTRNLDTVSGLAGAVPVILSLADAWKDEDFLRLATRCGDAILAKAQWSSGRCTWDTEHMTGTHFPVPLAGMAHGASGMAVALLSLYKATGRSEFVEAARGSFAYEDSLFDPSSCNWKDARFSSPKELALQHQPIAWCHGAGGIALARLVARTLDKQMYAEHNKVAEIALATTKRGIDERMKIADYDVSLCHGLFGLSEVLWTASVDFGTGEPSVPIKLAHQLLDAYEPGMTWPCGTQSGRHNPSLMIGLAGIGHHLLRLFCPTQIRSVLLADC